MISDSASPRRISVVSSKQIVISDDLISNNCYITVYINKIKMKCKKIPIEVSIYIRYLHQHGKVCEKDLLKKFPQYSSRSIYRHASLPVGQVSADGRKKNKGRPKLITGRESRRLISCINQLRRTEHGVFNSVHLQDEAELTHVSNRTVRRVLNLNGYGYRQCRKKGQLTEDDLKVRLNYARLIKRKKLPESFWEEGIAFYLYGLSFVHKTNPCAHAKSVRTRTWRMINEGLSINCTGKGKKEGTGGSVTKFMVAIAFGKGVIEVHQYTGPINGEKFSDIVHSKFNKMFQNSANPTGRYFVQDNDPSQNSNLAKEALVHVNAHLFKIPPRSPDLNPIENIFHLAAKKIRNDAKKLNIQKENYFDFSYRCKKALLDFPTEIIDKTVASMNKRIDLVIKGKGQRTKY